MEKNEQLMTQGFNAGYLLQKFEPELAQTLLANLAGVEEPYAQGMVAGAKEFELEKEMDKSDIFPGMDEDFDIDISEDLDKDVDMGKDDFDIDI